MNDLASSLADPALFRNACLIGGEWVAGDENDTLEVVNPANGRVIGKTPRLGKAEALAAIDFSETAQAAWAKETATHRANILKRCSLWRGQAPPASGEGKPS